MGRDVWVDRFRPVAAAMVVAIHTAPLAEVSPVLGEAVVYGVFRVAVPFFLMVAGRYVLAPFITRHPGSRERVRRYVRRSIATYLLATAAYLPLMAYAGNLPGAYPRSCSGSSSTVPSTTCGISLHSSSDSRSAVLFPALV